MNASLRDDFPLLKRRIDDTSIVYLDSAATSLKPWSVLNAEQEYSTRFTANVHRGRHSLSEEATFAYESARRRVARFLNASPENIVFVRNATEAANLVAAGLGLSKTDVVLCLSGNHHSNLVPWMRHAKVIFLADRSLEPIDPFLVERAILEHRPRVLAFSHASNLTGVIHPAAEICHVAKRHGVISFVDAAQSAPHLLVNAETLGCDFLALSGHKMLGPTGIGVLFGRHERMEKLTPLNDGGGAVDRVWESGYSLKEIPHRLEAGTPHISGALGLAAAIDYLEVIGEQALRSHDQELARTLHECLRELPLAHVLMPKNPQLAIASVIPSSDRAHPDLLASALSDSYKIMVRSGYHCTHIALDQLGAKNGALRISAYLYNTQQEIQALGSALRNLILKSS